MAVCACVRLPTPRTADVTVTKIAGYVRVGDFFRIFGIHTFYATATLLNKLYEYACNELMQRTVVVGKDWTVHPWRYNSSNVGGVTAGQE